MAKIITVVLCLGLLCACSDYYKVDKFYEEADYYNAYQTLKEIKDSNSVQYLRRLYQIGIRIALNGDREFITNALTRIVMLTNKRELSNFINFSRTFLLYYNSAREPKYLSGVITNFLKMNTVPDEFHDSAYKIRGISHYQLGNYSNAIDDLLASYKISPYSDNYYFVGMSYSGLNNFEKAINYFDLTITTTEDHVLKSLAYYQKAELFFELHNYSNALDQYINAVNQNCNNAALNYRISKCMKKLGYKNSVINKFLKISVRIDENFATGYFYLNLN